MIEVPLSAALFLALVAFTIIERIAELWVGNRNRAWSMARGGIEFGQGHWPWMVALHTVFLVCMPLEVLFAPTKPVKSVALLMILLALISQGLRWWCIRSLGFNWNPKVIVVPGLKRVQRGPYRWMNHPNYVAVAVEGIALPMVHFCWRTAVGFTLGNAILMVVRIRCENNALRHLEGHES